MARSAIYHMPVRGYCLGARGAVRGVCSMSRRIRAMWGISDMGRSVAHAVHSTRGIVAIRRSTAAAKSGVSSRRRALVSGAARGIHQG